MQQALTDHGYEDPSRRLLDAGPLAPAEASITVVNTARQLQAALQSQAQDVEIRGHLDLSALPLASGYNISFLPTALGTIISTRSIRVRFWLRSMHSESTLYLARAEAVTFDQ